MLDQNTQKNEVRLTMRIASLPEEGWNVKAAEWNLELNTKYRTYRGIGRPRRRWEDEILKSEDVEVETTTRNEMKHNNAWIEVAKNLERWRIMENDYAKTTAERATDNAARRRNFAQDQIRPARYLNGVRLDDNEVASNNTLTSKHQHTQKRKQDLSNCPKAKAKKIVSRMTREKTDSARCTSSRIDGIKIKNFVMNCPLQKTPAKEAGDAGYARYAVNDTVKWKRLPLKEAGLIRFGTCHSCRLPCLVLSGFTGFQCQDVLHRIRGLQDAVSHCNICMSQQ